MSQIQISHLTFSYEGSYQSVFEDLSITLDSDWKLGLIGRNGRGKTTFLKLLMGELEYRGVIYAKESFVYFPYTVADKTLTVRAVFNNLAADHLDWELERELSLLGIAHDIMDHPFSRLSQGEQTKVLLAVLFLKENNFLLIDEPTNHLDLESREIVSAYLNRKHGFIVVSHDRAFLDACIDHVLSINRQSIDIQRGNYSSWQQNKQQQDELEKSRNEDLKKDIKRLAHASKRTAMWSDQIEKSKLGGRPDNSMVDRGYIGHQAAKMMKRAKSLEARQDKAIEEKTQLLRNIDHSFPLKIHPLSYNGPLLGSLKDIVISYGGQSICAPVTFTIRPGDRIALRGRNGSGKSSLMQLIRGEAIDHDGEISVGSRLKISYIPQDATFLAGSLKVFAFERKLDESLFKAILNKLGLAQEQFDVDLKDYSAGQKKKVLLAASLSESAHLYIWDEPLNFIDITSRIQIEELIMSYPLTLLFVEHDSEFSKKIATNSIWLKPVARPD